VAIAPIPENGAPLLSSSAEDSFFRVLTESAPHIMFAAWPSGDVFYFNRTWYEYTGFGTEESLGPSGFAAALHSEDRARISDGWMLAVQIGRPAAADARYRRADGTFRWHRVSVAPHYGADGEIDRWIGTIVDIDDDLTSERSLRTLSEVLPVMVWTTDPSGRMDYFNQRWVDFIADRDEIAKGVTGRFTHPSDTPFIRAAWSYCVSTGAPLNEVTRLRVRDGSYRWHRINAVPQRDDSGAILRWYGVTTDVHDAIAASGVQDADVEGRIVRDLAQRIPTMVSIIDNDGVVRFINERWVAFTGLPADALLGERMNELVHPDDLAIQLERWQRYPRTGEAFTSQVRIRRADGVYRWVEYRALPEFDETGSVTQWIGVTTDIDENRRTVSALDFLTQAADRFAREDDIRSILRGLAHAALGGMAEVCVIDLLDDAAGSRIVVASPALGESFARAAEAYPPPPRDSAHPKVRALYQGETVIVQRIDDTFWDAMVDGETRRSSWGNTRPQSYLAVPIVLGDRIFGAISLTRSDGMMPFTQTDADVLQAVAQRVAVTMQSIRLRDELRRESSRRIDRFRRIADISPQLMSTTEPDGTFDWFNRRWYEYTGQTPDVALGNRWHEALHPEDRVHALARWRASLATREPFEFEARIRDAQGAYRWFLIRSTPELDDEGRALKWYTARTDIHDARRAARTIQVFADLGEVLSETLGLQQTLDAAMEVLVPDYADWSFITLADENDRLRIAAIYDANPEREHLLRPLLGKLFLQPRARGGSAYAYQNRAPFLFTGDVHETGRENLQPEALEIFERVGYESVISLPLIVAGEARGTLVLVMSSEQRAFREEEMPFFQELARRIAPAIANAEVFERERRVAESFQQAALPSELPNVPTYAFDAIYEAGRAEALVGGDWYDAFTLLDGRIVVSIGDVAGSGLQSAVIMSSIRQTIRGVAHVHAEPALMLEAADRTLQSEHRDRFATAFVGVIDPLRASIAYQSAGHLAPLIVAPDGTVSELESNHGLPLGLRTPNEPPTLERPLEPGSLLVLFTDGLVEATHDFDGGMRRVREAVGTATFREAVNPALTLQGLMLADGSKDDVAILVVRVGDPTPALRLRIDGADRVEQVQLVRRRVLGALAEGGMRAPALARAELILAELVGNLSRHAPGEAEFLLAWNEGIPVLHVFDSGPGYRYSAKLPPDPMSETGRGLFLIAAFARNFIVAPRAPRGSHSRIVFNL
jgi:PAS domain S-box-containing protein